MPRICGRDDAPRFGEGWAHTGHLHVVQVLVRVRVRVRVRSEAVRYGLG